MIQLSLTCQQIGRWFVLAQAQSDGGITRWFCRCDCGTFRVVSRNVLLDSRNKEKSCGCWRQDRIAAANITHGYYGTPTYRSWSSMRTRCLNSGRKQFKYWGGRGIRICERWMSFENFLADMGERPAGKTLDRFPNVNGHYEPENCRWATPKEQRSNHREAA